MVNYTGRGLVVKRPGVLSKVQMLTLVLGVGIFSLLPKRIVEKEGPPPINKESFVQENSNANFHRSCQHNTFLPVLEMSKSQDSFRITKTHSQGVTLG